MTAGIVVDNYKLDSFKKQLTENGFGDFNVVPFTKKTSTIKVEYEQSNFDKLKRLVKTTELNIKRSN